MRMRTESVMARAHEVLPDFHWAGTTTIRHRAATQHDAAEWARAIFDIDSAPLGVKVLFALRQAFATLLRIPAGHAGIFAVDDVVDGEAIIDADASHLRFVAGVRIDAAQSLVEVDTVVRFNAWIARVYFVPVRFLHDVVLRAMMRRAARRLSRRRFWRR